MKPDWDEASPQLARNLRRVLGDAAAHAGARRAVSVGLMRDWHAAIMAGLKMRDSAWAGCYRGDGAATLIGVKIGDHFGVDPDKVGDELKKFEDRLVLAVEALDAEIDKNGADTEDQIRAVIDLCAWAHGEWVRIHPFVNGSGRRSEERRVGREG